MRTRRRDRGLGEDLVVDEVLAGEDAADDRDEVVGSDVLEDERRGPGLDGVEERLLVLVDGEDDDPGRLELALDPLRGLDPAGRRQVEVHQDDVGAELDGHVDGAPAVRRLADDQEVRLALQDVAHPDAEQRVVVDEEDPRLLARAATVGSTPPPIRAAVFHAHLLSSRNGIASQTTVPPPGRDRDLEAGADELGALTHELEAEIPAAPCGDGSTSKPRPSSRISSTHVSSVDAARDASAAWPPRACGRSGAPPGRGAGRPSARRRSASSGRLRDPPRSQSPSSAAMLSTVSRMAPSSPSSSRTRGRSWLMKVRTSPSSRRSSWRRYRSSVRGERLVADRGRARCTPPGRWRSSGPAPGRRGSPGPAGRARLLRLDDRSATSAGSGSPVPARASPARGSQVSSTAARPAPRRSARSRPTCGQRPSRAASRRLPRRRRLGPSSVGAAEALPPAPSHASSRASSRRPSRVRGRGTPREARIAVAAGPGRPPLRRAGRRTGLRAARSVRAISIASEYRSRRSRADQLEHARSSSRAAWTAGSADGRQGDLAEAGRVRVAVGEDARASGRGRRAHDEVAGSRERRAPGPGCCRATRRAGRAPAPRIGLGPPDRDGPRSPDPSVRPAAGRPPPSCRAAPRSAPGRRVAWRAEARAGRRPLNTAAPNTVSAGPSHATGRVQPRIRPTRTMRASRAKRQLTIRSTCVGTGGVEVRAPRRRHREESVVNANVSEADEQQRPQRRAPRRTRAARRRPMTPTGNDGAAARSPGCGAKPSTRISSRRAGADSEVALTASAGPRTRRCRSR